VGHTKEPPRKMKTPWGEKNPCAFLPEEREKIPKGGKREKWEWELNRLPLNLNKKGGLSYSVIK